MRLLRDLFSFDGRITRQQFWLGHAAIFAISMLIAVVGGIVLGVAGVVFDKPEIAMVGPLIIGGIVSVGALIAETSLAVRRMHDRDGSAIWVMLLVGAVVILNVTIAAQRMLFGEPVVDPLTVGLTSFSLIMGGWMIYELGFLSGTRGRNRYGESPVQEAADGTEESRVQSL